MVDELAAAQPASLSAAKRNRLRCLKACVLAAARPDGPRLAAQADVEGGREEATKQVCGEVAKRLRSWVGCS